MAKKMLGDDDLMAVVLWIPKDAEKLKVTAAIGKHRAVMKLKRNEINKARDKYLDLDPDDIMFERFDLTKKGLEMLRQLEEESDDDLEVPCEEDED